VFGVCLKSVTNWIKLKKETGSLEIEAVPRSPRKLFKDDLIAYVKANPDASGKSWSISNVEKQLL
jgi:transposase